MNCEHSRVVEIGSCRKTDENKDSYDGTIEWCTQCGSQRWAQHEWVMPDLSSVKHVMEVVLRSEREMFTTLSSAQSIATKLAEELRLVKARLERFEGKPK